MNFPAKGMSGNLIVVGIAVKPCSAYPCFQMGNYLVCLGCILGRIGEFGWTVKYGPAFT